METIRKCGNCGSEIQRVTVSGGKRQWLFIPLILLVGFWPMMRMTLFKGDYTKDLVISEVETRENGHSIEILGLITNNGKKTWQGINVEAEFFDASGKFMDEESSYIRSDVNGHEKERFKIQLRSRDPFLLSEDTKVVVKISSARTSPY